MVRKSAAVYFAIQGLGILAWWCLLYFNPGSRQYFQMGSGEEVLLSFWLPDIIFLALGSLAAAFLLWTGHQRKGKCVDGGVSNQPGNEPDRYNRKPMTRP